MEVLKWLLLVVFGLTSIIFIFLLIVGSKLPLDSKILYFGELLSGRFYIYGFSSIIIFLLSFKILRIQKHSDCTIILKKDYIIIIKKSGTDEIKDYIILKIELLESGTNRDKIRIITNNYVRSFFLEVESDLTEDLKEKYSEKFEINNNVLQHEYKRNSG